MNITNTNERNNKEEANMRRISNENVEFTCYEGAIYGTENNTHFISSREGLMEAYENGCVVEAVVTEAGKNGELIFDFGNGCTGIMPAEEFEYNSDAKHTQKLFAINTVKCFFITKYTENGEGGVTFEFSRREVQKAYFESYLSNLESGSVIPAKVARVETKAAYLDLGYGYSTLLPIQYVSSARIDSVNEILHKGQNIYCEILERIEKRFTITHRTLIGGNCMNLDAMGYDVNDIVTGVIKSYIGDNAAIVCAAPGLNLKMKFADNTSLPCVGEYARMKIAQVNREKDHIVAYFIALADRAPDFTRFNYFIPEKAENAA